MQFSVVLLIICCFCSYNFFDLHTFCFAQYDRIGNTYEQIRDADFYKKPSHKYPERIGSYGEEQNSRKGGTRKEVQGFTLKQSTDGYGPRIENKNNDQNLFTLNKRD